jgi:hypothetical protein
MTRPDPGLQQQASVRTALRLAGPIMLGIGLLLTVIAFVDFFSSFSNPGFGMPSNFWMGFIGLPLLGIGAAITKVAFLGPASRYVAGEVTPTIRDTLGALGLGEGRTVCAACGTENDAGARFCDSCGKPLSRTCASCGAGNDADAKFCNGCGAPLPP